MPASDEIRRALANSGRLTVLTGAGVSAESGIATFRDRGGLWEEHRLEDVATPEAFDRDPALVHRFYNARRSRLPQVSPNPAHFALARIEEALGDRFTLITQNVDDLHERAGSRRVLHMHGELLKARCAACGNVLPWPGDLGTADRCASCRGPLRPHIVWFGEVPFHMEEEIPRALEAEVFMACGTSGSVYPAAAMVLEAKLRGHLTVEVNLEASEQARHFDLSVLGPAGTTLPRLVEEILTGP